MAKLRLKSEMNTILPADSVEWCPIRGFQNILVCGTYKQKDPPSTDGNEPPTSSKERVGSIYVLRIEADYFVTVEQTVISAGILDMKWCDVTLDDCPALGVATAAGELDIYLLKAREVTTLQVNELTRKFRPNLPPITRKVNELKLRASAKLKKEADKELLALSLDWSKDPNEYKISVSDSHGNISVFTLNSSGLNLDHHWNAHSHESWITSFDRINSSLVYSGGDDCLFKVFDVRCGNGQPQLTSKEHEAGVTSLHSNPVKHQYLASGSYDESLRVWDVRNLRRPIKSLNLGGGIWRIKWDPESGVNLATACMYNNFHIVADQPEKLELVSSFKENKSIAYGIDFCHCATNESKNLFHLDIVFPDSNFSLLSMCSFYDSKLYIAALSLDHIEESSKYFYSQEESP